MTGRGEDTRPPHDVGELGTAWETATILLDQGASMARVQCSRLLSYDITNHGHQTAIDPEYVNT